MTSETPPETALPPVPLTVEGASVLHQMMRFRRAAWRALPAGERAGILEEAAAALGAMERPSDGRHFHFLRDQKSFLHGSIQHVPLDEVIDIGGTCCIEP